MFVQTLFGQTDSLLVDKTQLTILSDTIPINNTQKLEYAISTDALEDEVNYQAEDSLRMDLAGNRIELFGGGIITFQSIKLQADYIVFDWENSIVEASGLTDPDGHITGQPIFEDGNQSFRAGKLRYNFETQKGIILETKTVQQSLYVQGSKTKFLSNHENENQSEVIYNKSAIFTTCDLDHPHYGIRSTKQKIIPSKVIVIGPSNVEIANIPTPLWLPFGFFPIKKQASTGLIFPKGYEAFGEYGFGINNIGWYFPFSDQFHLTLTSSAYVSGAFIVNAIPRYRKRYKYSGGGTFTYSSLNPENEFGARERVNSIIIDYNHRQDRLANPYRNFGGNIGFQTANGTQRTFNDASSVQKTSFNSNLSYTEYFPNLPINLTVGLSHNQNTETRRVTLNAPDVTFKLNRIYPFKQKERLGNKKWYEDIAFDYTLNGKGRLQATDTTFFDKSTLKNAQYGINYFANISRKFTIAKYFNLNTSIRYNETWFFEELNKNFDDEIITETKIIEGVEVIDTISLGRIITDTLQNLQIYRSPTINTGLDTKIFGTMRFRKGPIRGIRHQMSPSVSISYTPSGERYLKTVRNNSLDPNSTEQYSLFNPGVYSISPKMKESLTLNYNINNVFEAKIFNKKDSTLRNEAFIRSLRISGNYDFAADSLNFSKVRSTTNFSFLNGITNITLIGLFDPYAKDIETNKRIQKFYWKTNKKPLRFESLTYNMTNSISIKKVVELITRTRENKDDPGALDPIQNFQVDETGQRTVLDQIDPIKDDPLNSIQDKIEIAKKEKQLQSRLRILDLFDRIRINHTFNFKISKDFGIDTLIATVNNLNISGSLPLTDKWTLNIGSIGYDFKNKNLTYPSFGVNRNLHCWELGGSWQPQRGTFNFYVRVIPGSSLDFLEVPYRKLRGTPNVFDQ